MFNEYISSQLYTSSRDIIRMGKQLELIKMNRAFRTANCEQSAGKKADDVNPDK